MAITDDPDIVLSTKQRFADLLWGLPNVNAIAVAPKQRGRRMSPRPAIALFVTKKLPPRRLALADRIPRRLPAIDPAGRPLPGLEVLTDVEVAGPFFVAAPAVNTARMRPIVPGFSTSLRPVVGMAFPGTVGAAVIDLNGRRAAGGGGGGGSGTTTALESYVVGERLRDWRDKFFLTCAHVVTGTANPANTDVVQQATFDGAGAGIQFLAGRPDRWTLVPQILYGNLKPPIRTSFVDAAVVKLDRDVPVNITTKIKGIGSPAGQGNIIYADLPNKPQVQKSGRTTGLTKGTVVASSTDVRIGLAFAGISFGDPIMYRDHLLVRGNAGAMSEPGDSGALVLDDQRNAVGLCVGSDDSHMVMTRFITVMLDINHPRLSTGTPNRRFVLATRD